MSTVNKAQLYGKFQAGEDRAVERQDWKSKLYRKLCHKSLDIADEGGEPVYVEANKSSTGLDWKSLAVIGATGLAGYLGHQYLNPNETPPAVVQQAAQPLPAPAPLNPEVNAAANLRLFVEDANGVKHQITAEQLPRQ